MFLAYLVFARRQIHVADGPHGAQRGEEVLLVDSFLSSDPSSTSSEPLDDGLRKIGLPRASVIGEFCFPRKRTPDDAAGLVPPSVYFCFALTQPNGERVHGFSLRCHRPALDHSNKLDLGADWIECSVFLTRRFLPRLFPPCLQILRVRRYLDRASGLDFLSQLALADPGRSATQLLLESSSLNIACKYEFSLINHSPALVDALFDTTTSHMLHFILGAILLERRVLFVAKNEQTLSETMYAFDSLLVQLGSPITLGYPHNFVPILPGSMLEQGTGNPTPYMVGLLKIHLKAMDVLKDLGDMVIVDLDNRQIRLSPGSASLVPIGWDLIAGGDQRRSQQTPQSSSQQQEELNPWLDVATPFAKDIAQAYAQRDSDLLTCAVKSLLLHLVGPVKLEDPSLRSFHLLFSSTSIFKVHQANLMANPHTGLEQMLQTSRGFSAFRLAYSQANIQFFSQERQSLANLRQAVMELTGSSKEAVNTVNKITTELAKRTFDTFACREGIQMALQQRYMDSAARNWKLVFKTLGLSMFLIKAGSELCVAQLWDDLKPVFDFTRYSVQGVVGISSKVAEFVQRRAQELYSLVVDLHALQFVRSMGGHVMVQRSMRIKMQTSAKRIAGNYRADLGGLLSLTCPDSKYLDPNENETSGAPPPPPPPVQQQVVQPEPLLDLDFGEFTGSSGPPPPLPPSKPQPVPPPPPPIVQSAPPPPPPIVQSAPPPPPIAQEQPLLDLYSAAEDQQQAARARRPYTAVEEEVTPARPARPPAPQLVYSGAPPPGMNRNSSSPPGVQRNPQ
ncbi:hypothetical protein BASA81_001520 [Batrachochytrium salamandrivorans]|nr:hypothetical protein BASA81_001520 [Batrachochytrium salamandrivorans]